MSSKSVYTIIASIFFAGVALAALVHLFIGYPFNLENVDAVRAWWIGLCILGACNICIWSVYAVLLLRWKQPDDTAMLPRLQLTLSAAYVFGCAFRSLLPRTDVSRFVLFDSVFSSVIVGRSVATIAELCFVLQWALLLHSITKKDAHASFGFIVSRLLFPLIFLAEVCSWYAVFTTSYLGNILEESIWALSATLIVVSIWTLWSPFFDKFKFVFTSILLFGSAYVVYMCTVDVPMYVFRWLDQGAYGGTYLSLAEGFHDAATYWIVTARWSDWQWDLAWMSLYFSIGVWSSIALVHVSWYERAKGKI